MSPRSGSSGASVPSLISIEISHLEWRHSPTFIIKNLYKERLKIHNVYEFVLYSQRKLLTKFTCHSLKQFYVRLSIFTSSDTITHMYVIFTQSFSPSLYKSSLSRPSPLPCHKATVGQTPFSLSTGHHNFRGSLWKLLLLTFLTKFPFIRL